MIIFQLKVRPGTNARSRATVFESQTKISFSRWQATRLNSARAAISTSLQKFAPLSRKLGIRPAVFKKETRLNF